MRITYATRGANTCDGVTQAFDKSHRREYFFNNRTKQRRWRLSDAEALADYMRSNHLHV